MKTYLDNMKRVAPKSFAFLILIPTAALAAIGIAYIYFRQHVFSLPDCLIKRITGFPCPSCGLTRSVYALIHFRFLNSFMLHPLPVLASIFLLAVWLNALVNLFARKHDKAFPKPFIWYYSILTIVIIFWLKEIVFLLTGR